MIDQGTVRLAAALADRSRRLAAAQQLSAHLGAVALLILVEDATVEAFVPAPGFPQTLAGGTAWREFLQCARQPGLHKGQVGYPTSQELMSAIACTDHGIMLVFVGEDCNSSGIDTLRNVMPLLASTLRAEHEALTARGELQVAQDHARHAETLARALDVARSEVERTVLELGRQAHELHEARTRAEAATQAKDEFLAMLGHELRNPLSPILTALQLLRMKNQSSREQDVIERQVESLRRLVDDLLDVSRITRGKVELRMERVEVAEVAARAIEISSSVLEKKRQVLAVEIPPQGLIVDGDPSRLAQVFANLLTNAAKYSDPGTKIIFAAELEDAHIRIRVKDQGIGLAPELRTRVFDLFVQNPQAIDRSQGGLGLGLAIVRSLVVAHGGTVDALSEGEGKGSEFVVKLPRAHDLTHASPENSPVDRRLRRKARYPERVLVVDDNNDTTMLMSEALGSLGYEVRTASDGPTALRIAEEFKPHVALLDIGLPVMDGYELAARLRNTQIGVGLRLIAVTGYGQNEDRLRSQAVGFEAHLVKPITLELLQQVFEHVSERRSSHAGED
ncbi:MAG TPA: ATP-binding protein [Steroidobacteraceae bacterium]|nr:ATP-binding protein [Steroidobacteraceae bacterium]